MLMVSSEERSCRNQSSCLVSSRMDNLDSAPSSLDGIVSLSPAYLRCPFPSTLASLLSASSFSSFHCCYLFNQTLHSLVLRLGTRIQLTTVHDTTHFNELLVSNRANGYRDLLAVIDLSTYRRLSWEKNLPFFLVSFIVPETGEYLAVDPRSALKGVLEKAEEKGWTCMSGAEFEVGPVSKKTIR